MCNIKNRILPLALILVSVAANPLAVAKAQGGFQFPGSGPGTDLPSRSQETALNYMPLTQGTQWIYQFGNGAEVVAEVTRVGQALGKTVAAVTYRGPGFESTDYLYHQGGALRYMTDPADDDCDQGFKIKAPVDQPHTWSAETEEGANITCVQRPNVSIAVPAGSFSGIEVSISVATEAGTIVMKNFFVRDLGLVRQEIRMPNVEPVLLGLKRFVPAKGAEPTVPTIPTNPPRAGGSPPPSSGTPGGDPGSRPGIDSGSPSVPGNTPQPGSNAGRPFNPFGPPPGAEVRPAMRIENPRALFPLEKGVEVTLKTASGETLTMKVKDSGAMSEGVLAGVVEWTAGENVAQDVFAWSDSGLALIGSGRGGEQPAQFSRAVPVLPLPLQNGKSPVVITPLGDVQCEVVMDQPIEVRGQAIPTVLVRWTERKDGVTRTKEFHLVERVGVVRVTFKAEGQEVVFDRVLAAR